MSTTKPPQSYLIYDHPLAVQVVYTDDAASKPADTLNEINGLSANINEGFGGKFVWLRVPQGAGVEATPITSIGISISSTPDAPPRVRDDLAKGAGGSYRYLAPTMGFPRGLDGTYIAELGIWRSTIKQTHPPSGWSNMTSDINAGRGGDYLYLIWKTHWVMNYGMVNHTVVTSN